MPFQFIGSQSGKLKDKSVFQLRLFLGWQKRLERYQSTEQGIMLLLGQPVHAQIQAAGQFSLVRNLQHGVKQPQALLR